nr:MAG TPA: protein of unknown function (DUF4969) [Caudoviricetes sp.]
MQRYKMKKLVLRLMLAFMLVIILAIFQNLANL